MPRYSFIAEVSMPRTGPLSVGTTPAADAPAASDTAATAQAANVITKSPANSLRSAPETTPAPAFMCGPLSLPFETQAECNPQGDPAIRPELSARRQTNGRDRDSPLRWNWKQESRTSPLLQLTASGCSLHPLNKLARCAPCHGRPRRSFS